MENINIANILDKLENKNRLERIAKILLDFRYKAIVDWINRMDKKAFKNGQEYSDKVDKDVNNCAKDIMGVINEK